MEYPKMLCRAGSETDVNGVKIDTIIVDDEVAEITARDEGWLHFAEFVDAPELEGQPELNELRRRGRPPKQ